MSIVPKESALPSVCPLCGADADEHHHEDGFEAEWASYACELVLMMGTGNEIEWDNGCEVVLRRWCDQVNKARRASMSAIQQ